MAKNEALGMLIIVDTREQTPWRFSKDATVQRAKLDAGDYSLGGFTDRVAIERKSLGDAVQTFCNTDNRERFEDECRLLRGYEWKAIVIEASVDDVLAHAYRSQAHPNSVIGSTIAWWADFGIPTLWAGDATNAANIVERLFKRLWTKAAERAA